MKKKCLFLAITICLLFSLCACVPSHDTPDEYDDYEEKAEFGVVTFEDNPSTGEIWLCQLSDNLGVQQIDSDYPEDTVGGPGTVTYKIMPLEDGHYWLRFYKMTPHNEILDNIYYEFEYEDDKIKNVDSQWEDGYGEKQDAPEFRIED